MLLWKSQREIALFDYSLQTIWINPSSWLKMSNASAGLLYSVVRQKPGESNNVMRSLENNDLWEKFGKNKILLYFFIKEIVAQLHAFKYVKSVGLCHSFLHLMVALKKTTFVEVVVRII